MNKIALITGASSGIGKELAHIFAANQIDLILVACSEEKLIILADKLKLQYNIEAHYKLADLSDIKQAEQLYRGLKAENINIDYLVNNAGFGNYGFFPETDWKKEHQMINLNITALTYFSKVFSKDMISKGQGRILNIASMAAFQPGPLMSVYYATKAYVLFLSEALNNELKGTGVTCTTLCPGPTDTGFVDAANLNNSKLFSNKNIPGAYEVALYGYKAMMKGKAVAVPGFMNRLMVISSSMAPRSIALKIVRKMQEEKKK